MRVSHLARHGLWLPPASMVVGTALPWCGHEALGCLPVWTFAMVFCGVLSMPTGRPSRSEAATAVAIVVGIAILSPVLAFVLANLLHVPAELRALMVVAACAPVAQSVGALASILKLPEKGPVLAAVATSLAAPVILPLAGHFLGHDALAISSRTLALRAGLLVMAPATLAFLIRRIMPARCAAWRGDIRGTVILALSLLAAARGPGLRFGLTVPVLAAHLALLACAVAACAMFAGWALAIALGRENGLAGMFAVGMRNIPVAWAAMGSTLDAEGGLFMALGVVPFYLVPLVMRATLRWSRVGEPVTLPA